MKSKIKRSSTPGNNRHNVTFLPKWLHRKKMGFGNNRHINRNVTDRETSHGNRALHTVRRIPPGGQGLEEGIWQERWPCVLAREVKQLMEPYAKK